MRCVVLAGALAVLAAVVPPPLEADEAGETPFALFSKAAVPVLDDRCSGCHGVSLETLDRLRASAADPRLGLLRWEVDPSGRLGEGRRAAAAYETLTAGLGKGGREEDDPLWLYPGSPSLASPLLRAPLAAVQSGSTHPDVFPSTEDPDYQRLKCWVDVELASAGSSPATLDTTAARFFAESLVPVLVRKTCFSANCHGPTAFNDLKLDPGIPVLPGRFTPRIHRANRKAMLGEVTRLVHLSGDPSLSRQIRKCIPVEQGGIVHKGGNLFFEEGDPDLATFRRWLALEAEEARRRTGAPLGRQDGIVFVRRPRDTPERFFEDLSFLPGGDLIRRRSGEEINLTAALHPAGPADVRAPDVSPDGRKVAFAMRRSPREGFDIWEVDLASRRSRRLTWSSRPEEHYMDPLYAPDPDDGEGHDLSRVILVMVSNRAGGWCASSPDGILGEAEGGTRTLLRDRGRTERPGTYTGRELRVVKGTNRGATRRITRHESGLLEVSPPFDEPCDSTTHYVISDPPRRAPRFDAYRMRLAPPGEERATFEWSLTRMTWTGSQVRRPHMRSSGEIMFTCLRTGWQSGRPFYNGAIFRTHLDGSNFHTHNGNRSGVPIHAGNREMGDGLEVRIGRDANSFWGGMLMLSDHQFGPTIEPDSPVDDLDHPGENAPISSSLFRFVPGWISLDESVRFRGISPGGAYRDPYPLPDGSLLVSYTAGPLDLDDPEAAPDFDILRLVPEPSFQNADGTGPGRFRREVLVTGPLSELWPRPVAVRLKEPVKKRLKLRKDLFGPPSLPPESPFDGYREGTPAVLEIYDVPLLDAFFEQATPAGPKHVALPLCPSCGEPTPEIARVTHARIIGLVPDGSPGETPAKRVMIAEVPLAADGSIQVALPSRMSFDIQSVNPLGMALRSPNRWLYCLPGERHTLSIPRVLFAQTCGGCHGGLTGSPRDTFHRPDLITSASRTLSLWDSERDERRDPSNWRPGEPGPTWTAVDFEEDLRPILKRRCTGCHGGLSPASGLTLEGGSALSSLLPYVNHREALAVSSYLLEKLLGRELMAPRRLTGDAPHPSEAPLGRDEIQKFIRWIDLGASPGRRALD